MCLALRLTFRREGGAFLPGVSDSPCQLTICSLLPRTALVHVGLELILADCITTSCGCASSSSALSRTDVIVSCTDESSTRTDRAMPFAAFFHAGLRLCFLATLVVQEALHEGGSHDMNRAPILVILAFISGD